MTEQRATDDGKREKRRERRGDEGEMMEIEAEEREDGRERYGKDRNLSVILMHPISVQSNDHTE